MFWFIKQVFIMLLSSIKSSANKSVPLNNEPLLGLLLLT